MRSVVFVLVIACSMGLAPALAALTVTPNGANPMTLECHMSTYQELGATVSGAVGGFTLSTSGSVNVNMPGDYFIQYTARDGSGQTATAVRLVQVRDTIAPTVNAFVAKNSLWPNNHNLINVGFNYTAEDACDPQPLVRVMVFANEDDEMQTGDGRHAPDAKNISRTTLRLRAERKGDGPGRVYLIVVTATDASGNTGFSCTTVTVAHDQSKKSADRVRALAAQFTAACPSFASFMIGNGRLPAGSFIIGDGPVIGPKQ
jgi:hypothetical protein